MADGADGGFVLDRLLCNELVVEDGDWLRAGEKWSVMVLCWYADCEDGASCINDGDGFLFLL
jgi:hypothetical protein